MNPDRNSEEDVDVRLARLGRATEGVRPRPDFAARVARAVDATAAAQPGRTWLDDVWSSARRIVPAAALVAALGAVWAVTSDRAYDDAVAGYDDVSELADTGF